MQITVNGISTRYNLQGPESAPVVMLSHSLATTMEMWDPQAKVLSQNYRVLSYDTRGHGGTEAPAADYTLEQLADDAVALLDALNIDKVHWVGISMGGMIGQCMALHHPDRLQSLALCATMSNFPAEAKSAWDERLTAVHEGGMEKVVDGTIERWFSPEFVAQDPPIISNIKEMIRTTPVDGYIGCSRAIFGLSYTEQLSRVQLPSIIIVGENDPGTPVEASEVIHQHLPGSQLVILPHVRHLCNLESPDAFDRALLEFLQAQ